jgi:hypothetical protein
MTLVGLDGQPLKGPKGADADHVGIHKWNWRTHPKCGPNGLCPGILALMTDSMRVSKNKGFRFGAVGDMTPDGKMVEPHAVGLMYPLPEGGTRLLMFNYCPACGNKIPLAESRGF